MDSLLHNPSDSDPLSARAELRRRRAEILAETAEALLAGKDPDTEVMPALFRSLAAEKIVDATLGYIVTEMQEGMKLGFMQGFDQAMMQRCLRRTSGRPFAEPSP